MIKNGYRRKIYIKNTLDWAPENGTWKVPFCGYFGLLGVHILKYNNADFVCRWIYVLQIAAAWFISWLPYKYECHFKFHKKQFLLTYFVFWETNLFYSLIRFLFLFDIYMYLKNIVKTSDFYMLGFFLIQLHVIKSYNRNTSSTLWKPPHADPMAAHTVWNVYANTRYT